MDLAEVAVVQVATEVPAAWAVLVALDPPYRKFARLSPYSQRP